jgi:Tol biopolymer transport system component/DNA-binding winged helix-turn-helix (wHTH) protein
MNSKRPFQTLENTGLKQTFSFGEFTFDAVDKILWRGGEVVSIPPKTRELLFVFVENAGQILSKEDLMNLVWKDVFVEEANLSHHIAVLRKALGETKEGGARFIQTIPRKGYRFVAPLSQTPIDTVEVTVNERTITEVFEEIEIETKDFATQTIEQKTTVAPQTALQNKSAARRKPFLKPLAILASLAVLSFFGAAIFGVLNFASNAGSNSAENQLTAIKTPMTIGRITNSGKLGASSIAPDGKFIAYVQNYTDGVGAIYVRQSDTNVETRLATHEKGEFGTTAFSPDGTIVYYAVNDASHPEFGLYRVPLIGGAPVRLVEKLDNGYFALAPDGKQAVVVRFNSERKQSALISIKLDGSGSEQILTTRPFSEMTFQPGGSWSPSGKTFVFPVMKASATKNYSQETMNVAEFDATTGEIRDFTRETWAAVGITRWMKDASGVVVIGRQPRMRNQIYFIAAATGEVSRITSDATGYGNYGLGITDDGAQLVADAWEFQGRLWAMEPNGAAKTAVQLPAGDTTSSAGLTTLPGGQIVYSTRTNFNFDLWTLSANGTEAKPLTSDAFFDRDAVATPDGSFIVFASDRAGAGTSHLFRMNPDGTRIEQITSGENLEDSPDVSPDGKWVIYRSSNFDAVSATWTNAIWKIASEGEGAPVKLTENCYVPFYSPDGKMFSCIAPEDNYKGKIVVAAADDGQKVKTFHVDFFLHTYLPARWTPDGEALIFRRQENQVTNLWRQDLAGGAPVKFTDFQSESIFNFAFARDGKRLFLSRGNSIVNVVLLKNFRQ